MTIAIGTAVIVGLIILWWWYRRRKLKAPSAATSRSYEIALAPVDIDPGKLIDVVSNALHAHWREHGYPHKGK